jgi:adenosine deaminase
MKDFIRSLPKVELHDHLDGGLRPATAIELAAECGLCLHTQDPEELGAWFRRGADRASLSLYLEGFSTTTAVMQSAAALERVARESVEDLAAEGVVYAEIRFAPILHTERGLDLETVVSSVLKGLEAGKATTGMGYGLIICALRNMDARLSLEAAELAVAFRDRGVVGFDLAGDEHGHPPKRHLEAFQFIRNRNFNITIHAGEAFGPESIWQAIQICGAQRIGHGTRLIEDMDTDGRLKPGSLASYVRDRRIPLECCLSSNVQTGAAASIDKHPFRVFYRDNFRVCLCSDNRLMSGTNLTHEMGLAVERFGLRLADLEKITINAMKSAFIDYDDRVAVIYGKIKPGYAKARAMPDRPLD